MERKEIPTLVVVAVLVLLSLLAAGFLYGILASTGIFKNQLFEVGGAAAGFLATLWLLDIAYRKVEAQRLSAAEKRLKEINRQLEKQIAAHKLEDKRLAASTEQRAKQVARLDDERKRLEDKLSFMNEELARYVASKAAYDCVNNNRVIEGLDTDYGDTWATLKVYFHKLGDRWLEDVLLPEFERAILQEAGKIAALRNWRPKRIQEKDIETVKA